MLQRKFFNVNQGKKGGPQKNIFSFLLRVVVTHKSESMYLATEAPTARANFQQCCF